MTTACALAFGGNAAESEDYFQQAIAELAKSQTVCQSFAKVIRSAPMGAAAGSEFVNSAGIFQTNLSPQELLKTIHEIESGFGRQRSLHWGPRPIDIDVLLYGQQIIDTTTIVIPHPCLWYRCFVVQPLCEICPTWIHPVFNQPVEELNQRLNERPLRIRIQNQHTSLAALEIAKLCWNNQDHPFVAAIDHDADGQSFCTVVVERAKPQPANQKPRLQPRHESSRIIRCILQQSDDAKSLRQFLTDLEAAVLG